MKRHLPHLLVFLAVAAAYLSGWLAPLEFALMDLRFSVLQRDAGGGIVVVDIDAKSLRALDVWPWPRRYHANVVDRLAAAGAGAIALDIDFSSRSAPEDDARLAAALERAGGRVVLPVFKQFLTRPGEGGRTVVTQPLPALGQAFRTAAVNVRVEADGRIRRYAVREREGGTEIASMAAALLGRALPARDDFYVDFGIRAETLPHLSYVDVLNGAFDPGAVAGKAVIVGATAVELGDTLTVPVYSALPGAVLQAMAYESLAQGRTILRSAPGPVLLVALLLALVLGPRFARWSWRRGGAALAACIAAGLLVPAAVQATVAVSLDSTPWLLVPFLCYALGLWRIIDTQALSIFRHRFDSLHRRAMMQSVVDDSFDGIAIANSEGLIEVFNPAAEALLGCGADAVTGTPIHSLLPWSREIERLYEGGEGCAPDAVAPNMFGPSEFTIQRRDGSELVVELVVSCSRLSITRHRREKHGGERKVFIYTFRDVTQRRRAEQAQQKAMEQITAASRAKTEFLANMSHELRTPLNAVIGFSEVIKAEPFGPVGAPEYVEYIEDIHQSGQHLLSVINDILDMSKIEAGEMEPKEAMVDVRAIARSCLRLVAERARRAGIALADDIPETLPWLQADERMVKQMLLNLLSNAIKFTPEGGHVRLRAEAAEPAGSFVLSVADTGIGIAAEDMEVVLQPFGQADTSLERRYEGTGLGLPLVKSMAALHGGVLMLDSTLGKGTTASLRFPAARIVARESKQDAA